ncbi:MAG: radical SAM protein [archaeon]
MKNLQMDLSRLKKNISSMGIEKLRLSITNNCNASCGFCHNEGHAKGIRNFKDNYCESSIPLEQIVNVADVFRDTVDKVKFTGGEPTLVDKLDKIIKKFYDRDYICSMTTNGFNFDEEMQKKLQKSGLTQVSITIPSLSPRQHASFFGQKNVKLYNVLENVASVSDIFDSYKINFMASSDTVPSQLIPMNELSASTGIPISIMELVDPCTLLNPVSKGVIDYMEKHVGLEESIPNINSHTKGNLYKFKNGGTWEVDDFRDINYREKAFGNKYCNKCNEVGKCTEGPYSLRIGKDLVAYPCLIRKDNGVKIKLEESL